jgi:cytochrome b561
MLGNMGDVMKDSYSRLLMIEHPLTMLIAITLLTIGRAKIKRETDSDKRYKQVFIFFGIALVLIVIRIPWQYIN